MDRSGEATPVIEVIRRSRRGWFPVPLAAKLCGKSRSQIYRDIQDNKLKAERLGPRGLRIPKQALVEYLKQWSN